MIRIFRILSAVTLLATAILTFFMPDDFKGLIALITAFCIVLFGCIKLYLFLKEKELDVRITSILLFDAILALLAGTLLLFRGYAESPLIFTTTLGIWAIMTGVFRTFLSIKFRKNAKLIESKNASKTWFLYLLIGLLGIISGVLVLWFPVLDYFKITFFISANFALYGVYDILEAVFEK